MNTMRSYKDILYKEGLCLDVHLPEVDEFDVFVYFHGGGLCEGSRKGVEVFATTLAKRGIATVSVEYSMYPDAKYPDFIVDSADSIRWVKDNLSTYGKVGKVYVGGSSAGAYISMMLCFDKRYLLNAGVQPDYIDGYIHDAGQPTVHFNVLVEHGLDGKRVLVDERSPMYFVGTDESYPPMLYIVANQDMPGRYEQTMLMINTLSRFGHADKTKLVVMDGRHCSYTKRADDNGEGVLANLILEFVEEKIK